MTNVVFDSDGWIYMNGNAVARIAPNLSIGNRREFEDWLCVGPVERAAITEDANEKAQAQHEAKPTIEQIKKAVSEALDSKSRYMGLITRDELDRAFEAATDELLKPE